MATEARVGGNELTSNNGRTFVGSSNGRRIARSVNNGDIPSLKKYDYDQGKEDKK
jgi:hypothetical protein